MAISAELCLYGFVSSKLFEVFCFVYVITDVM